MAKDNEQVESLFTDGELEEIQGMIDRAIEGFKIQEFYRSITAVNKQIAEELEARDKRPEFEPGGFVHGSEIVDDFYNHFDKEKHVVEPKEGEYYLGQYNPLLYRVNDNHQYVNVSTGSTFDVGSEDFPLTKAGEKSVENELIEEAKRRGHKEGVRVESLHEHGLCYKLHFGQLEYYPKDDDLCDRSGNIIYEKGQWTTIDKQSIKDRIIELIKKEL